ncbi:MAG: alanine racemase [Verrucomicrobiota bacterium]|nr:alanine racemase [Verrucomicrobiota bacterium]
MSHSRKAYRLWAEIDLDALRHNVAAVRAQVGTSVRIMAVVKANAYGHGVREVVRAIARQVEMFGVANVIEAIEVRESAPGAPVFILGPALAEERAEIVARGFVPAVSSIDEAAAYSALAGPQPAPIHLKIDTGMGRIGIWQNEAIALAAAIRAMPGVVITGLASHLPVADEDDAFTREQLEQFARIASKLRSRAGIEGITHIENSAGLIGFPAQAGDMVRAGLVLYGSAPRAEFQSRLRQVMTWKTRVTLVRQVGSGRGISYGRAFVTERPMRIATLAAGYADGYQRHLSDRGAAVLIGGRRCPVLGRVTMDQIMADVTALPEVQPGEEVVLTGRQGAEEILARELAEKARTIAWEIFTGIGPRVVRVYRGEDQ